MTLFTPQQVIQAIRPALAGASAADRAQFAYDVLREVYDAAKFDTVAGTARGGDGAEEDLLAPIVSAAFQALQRISR